MASRRAQICINIFKFAQSLKKKGDERAKMQFLFFAPSICNFFDDLQKWLLGELGDRVREGINDCAERQMYASQGGKGGDSQRSVTKMY